MRRVSRWSQILHDPVPSAAASTHLALSALPVQEAKVAGTNVAGALPWLNA